jgi:hypothetical protein
MTPMKPDDDQVWRDKQLNLIAQIDMAVCEMLSYV